MVDDFQLMARAIYQQLGSTLAAPVFDTEAPPIELVGSAVEIQAKTNDLVAAAVGLARAAGTTWQEIGDVLGVSRQAAFQRFGKPIDPRTGAAMNITPLPEAASLAEAVIDNLANANWNAIAEEFDTQMSSRLNGDGLAAAWAQVLGTVGAFEVSGPTEIVRAADLTTTTTPLHFEAGDLVARISFNDDRSIAGLYILPPLTAT
jgi:hypothetical protein